MGIKKIPEFWLFDFWCLQVNSFSKIRVMEGYKRQCVCGLFFKGLEDKERILRGIRRLDFIQIQTGL